MAQSDWTILADTLSDGACKRGVTSGIAAPNGGGTFVYACNSLDATVGAFGMAITIPSFGQLSKGASIRGCIQRGVGGGNVGFSPFLFASLQGANASATNVCYMLGLSDDDPSRIVLAKGPLSGGVHSHSHQVVKAKGTESFSIGTWVHLRMDVIQNSNGDVVINCFRNDLTNNALSSPVWNSVVGMSQLIDDIAQINTGSEPLDGGYAGIGFASSAPARRSYFDGIELYKQV